MTLVRFAPVAHRLPAYRQCPARRSSTRCSPAARGGRFLLRLDDTDRERSTEDFADAIAEDLAWLGIVPDLFARQIRPGGASTTRPPTA